MKRTIDEVFKNLVTQNERFCWKRKT